jgi:hypothetical protein
MTAPYSKNPIVQNSDSDFLLTMNTGQPFYRYNCTHTTYDVLSIVKQYTCTSIFLDIFSLHTCQLCIATLRHNVNIWILIWNNSFMVWYCTHLHIHGLGIYMYNVYSYFLPRYHSAKNNQISKDPGQRMCKWFFLLLLTKKNTCMNFV